MDKDTGNLTCMAEIVGMHGIKGMVKLKIFGDNPAALTDYAPLCDANGKKTYKILKLHEHGNILLAEIENIQDRTAAEKLRGVKLYLPREALPAIKDDKTFYHADLVGMRALDKDGKPMGKVISVDNFGAGDLLEIKPIKGASYYLPFNNSCVPNIDTAKKEVTIEVPPGLLD